MIRPSKQLVTQWCFVLCLFGAFSVAMASPRPPPRAEEISEALSGLKPATGFCPADVGGDNASHQSFSGFSKPDLDCAIPVPEAALLAGRADTVFVDIRTPSEFQNAHVDGALNIRLEALPHKTFLHGKTVVLVGNGASERDLYEACAVLKKSPIFRVRVLKGGVTAWASYGYPLLGRESGGATLGLLRADELLAETMFDANLILVNGKLTAVEGRLSRAVRVPGNRVEDVTSAVTYYLGRQKKQSRGRPVAGAIGSVVWVTGGGVSDSDIERTRHALKPIPLLVYNETEDSLVRETSLQKMIWAAQSRKPKQPKCGL